jgi:beta-lactam-binding protein with PASTA domain
MATGEEDTVRYPNVVLGQSPVAGAAVKPGTAVALTMHDCPP